MLRTLPDKVERDYHGQVLKIEFERDDDRFIHEIRRLQEDGHLAKLKVDTTSGKVLKIKIRAGHLSVQVQIPDPVKVNGGGSTVPLLVVGVGVFRCFGPFAS